MGVGEGEGAHEGASGGDGKGDGEGEGDGEGYFVTWSEVRPAMESRTKATYETNNRALFDGQEGRG